MFIRKKRIFKSSRVARKKRKEFAIRGGMTLSLLFFLFVGFAWLSWLPEVNIDRIAVIGNTTVPEEDVRVYIEQRIDGGYLNLFSRANVFLFQPSIIEEELLDTFRKIEQINISRDSFRSIVVEINERKPYYIWCDTSVSENESPKSCYFLDINGFAFAPAPLFSGRVYFEFHSSFEERGENPTGEYFLLEHEFKRLISFRNSLRELNLDARAMTIDERGDFSFLLADSSEIIFSPDQDFDLLFTNLLATFDTGQFSGSRVGNTPLEYIDLRFDNKVYYQLQ